MPKSVNIPGVGVVNFPDAMPNEQINSIIKTEILPKYGQAPKPPVGQGGVLAVGLGDFITSLTDIPGGIAEILGQTGFIENPEESALSKFSAGAKAGWQDILGINPEAERTAAETGAGALGSVASFFVPGTIGGKVAKGLGAGAKAVRAAQFAGAGAAGAPLKALNEAENIRAFEAAGGVVTPGEKQVAILSNAVIGLSDILPLGKFFGPLERILAKVPLSKAGTVAEIMETGIKRAVRSATEEGSQEAISQLAQNLVAKGLYNPDLDPTEGLLGNAAAGGFAGGTVDVILQLMAGRKIRKANTARGQLEAQIDTEVAEAAPELIRAQAIDGLNTLRTAAPTGAISVIESQMPGDRTASFYIVGADKKPIVKFDSIDAAIAAGKQYEADSNGATKFEPPTITELVKMKKAKTPKLTKAQKNQARQEAKRLKAAGQLQPAPITGPATTPEGQATTAASIEKTTTEDNLPASEAAEAPLVAPKKGRKKLAPIEPIVAEGALPPTDTAAEITLPEQPAAPPAAAPELTADQRVAIWKSIAPQAQSFRELTPEQQAAYFEALKKAQPPADQASKLSAAPAAPPAPATPPAPTEQEVPEGFRQVTKEIQPTVRVGLRPLNSTPEGAAKAAEMDAKRGRVADALNKVLSPIVAKDVRLNLVSNIASEPDEKGNVGYARGVVNPEGTVIDLAVDIYDPALTEEQLIDKLTEVMNHEVIHTLTNAKLLTPAEVTTLFNATDKIKYQGKAFTYFDRAYRTYAPIESYTTVNEAGDRIPNMDMITEEAVAEMFRDYRAGKLKIGEKPKGIFNKIIQFFKRLFRGFREAQIGEVFTRIESGEVGGRKRGATPAGAATKLSAVPANMRRILEPSFRQFQAGEITREEWDNRVNTLKPVKPYPSVPKAPSLDEVRDAIGAKGEAKGVDRIGLAHRILKTGDRVKSRLDIPAYENKGVWVETIRSEDGKFEGASYDRAGMFTNVKFDVKERQAESVAAGETAKSPFAVIEGDWVDMTPEQIQARAEQVFNDPEWRQVGMDPTRHSYFYDRKTMEPVVSAEEVIQIGPLVLAKNAKTAPAAGFKFSITPQQFKDSDWGRVFGGPQNEELLNIAQSPTSRSTIVAMTPDEYIAAAAYGLRNPGQENVYGENVARGMNLSRMPYLALRTTKDGSLVVDSHDGRHRALALKNIGFNLIPVHIRHEGHRWGVDEPLPDTMVGQGPLNKIIKTPDSIFFPKKDGAELGSRLLSEEAPSKRIGVGIAPDPEVLSKRARAALAEDPNADKEWFQSSIEERMADQMARENLNFSKEIAETAQAAGAKLTYASRAIGVFGGEASEPSSGTEAVTTPENEMDVANDVLVKTFQLAKTHNQRSAFVSRTIREDERNQPYARPGLTLFFYPVDDGRTARTIKEVESIISRLPKADVLGGFTAMESQSVSKGDGNEFQAIRFIWIPEYAGVEVKDLASNWGEVVEALDDIAIFAAKTGIGSAKIEHYDVAIGYEDNYDEQITAAKQLRAKGDVGDVGSTGPWRRSIGSSVASRTGVTEEELGRLRDRGDLRTEKRKFSVIPRAAGDWATTGAPPPGVDSQNANGISPYRISQRRPRGTGAASSLTDDLEISTDAMRLAEKAWRHNSTVVLRSYNIMPLIPGESGDDTARRFVRHLADNLLFLHDMIPVQIRDRSKLWYDGARAITTNLAQQYNLPDSAVAAVIASESPQKDWYQNVSLAKRTIDIVKNNSSFAFSDRMLEKAKELKSLKKYDDIYNMMAINNANLDNIEQLLRKKKGNMLAAKQISEKEFDAAVLQAKALFVRIFDETYNSRDYNIISPEGNEMGIAKNKSGKNASVAWGSLKEIGKAISVVEDPSKENIDAFLGFRHKVRNFYNNIISPNAGSDLTSDTHAVAAGFLKPFGGGALEVHHNFGTSKKGNNAKVKNSGPLGVQGTYGLIADAYRLAAAERDILPREMQSITWEAVRALFKPEMKRNKKFISLVNDTWSRYADGKITIKEARQKILEAANAKQGIDSPTWWAGPLIVPDEDVRETPDAGDLRQDELGGRGGPEDADSRAVVGDTKRAAEGIAKRVSSRTFGGENLDNFAKMANNEVRKAVRKLSAIPQSQPQSAFFQAANATLFASVSAPTSTGEKFMDLLGGFGTSAGRTKIMDAIRVNYVQKQGQIAKYQRVAELAGKFESGLAEYSAIASSEAADRASHQIPIILEFGSGEVLTINNDPNSKYFIVNENEVENAPSKVFKLVYTGGPNNTSLMDQFKTILVARAVVKRQKEGKPTPIEVTPEYIRRAEDLALQYPVLEDAYNRYQKFNRKMIKAAVDAGFISQDTFQKFTDDMNYYSLYREVGDETLTPPPYGATGRATKIQAYKGSDQGKLIADPMEAMIRNISFWTAATMRNIAAQKAHRVAMTVGIGRNLKWLGNDIGWESPDPNKGEDARYLSYNIDGKEFRYAVTDPLFATGLLNTEGHNMGLALELLGMPTTALRELVTRDPGFMIANLLRDSMSTWILAGSGASPLGTFIGLKKALMNDVSYQSLKRMGVVGSYDEAQKSPRQMVAGLKAKVTNAQGLTGTMDALKYGWDRLGKLSDASDAATRIAVYEAAIKEGATEYTAAYRALSVMNFSRRGASMGISVATKLIPFLNARIQGFDVLYTGIKAGVQLAQGAEQTAFEKQRGAAVWYRGAGLMAAALALAMLNEDDEDYKELPPYVKDANFLIPVGGSQFISIPKPFEAGLIFGTVPTTMYDIMRGNRSTRSGIKLFTSQLGSTFGFNPMPQVALPFFENLTNSDFYTGMPLISPGMQKLDPSLQYNSSTSYVARGLGKLLAYSPFGYDFESGRFEGVSPIMIDNLITGYGGPIGGYVSMGIGGLIGAFGQDNQGIPIAGSNLPVIRRFFIDAQDRQPNAAAEAYEVYQLVDKATRTASRLKNNRDVEALREFREENIDLLRVGKQVRKMAENLNNIRAQVRRLEVNTTMSGSEKKERMRELRAREIQLTRKIYEINEKLGR